MGAFENIVIVVCLIAYTVFSVWVVKKCLRVFTGVVSSLCLVAGSIGLYLAAPFIAIAVMWIIRILIVIGVITLLMYIFGG